MKSIDEGVFVRLFKFLLRETKRYFLLMETSYGLCLSKGVLYVL